MSSIRGWPSSKKKGDTQGQHVTIEPMGQEQNGMTVSAKVFVYQVATDAVEAGSTTTVINASAHLAKAGDVIRFTSGALNEIETKVIETATNSITVADTFSVAPTAADTFQILRPRWANVNAAGELPISLAAAPIQFVLDSVDTEVEEDTGTPGNSIPLPVKVLDAAGLVPDFATQTTLAAVNTKLPAQGQALMAASVPVVIASNQSAVPVSGPLTDVQLRATAVPVSGPLTDTQLRASAVPISAAALPLPSGAATQATLASVETEIGGLTESAPVTDTASSGLNGRLQRIAQRLTSLIALIPLSLGQKNMAGSFAVTIANDQSSLPVAGATPAALTVKQAKVTVGTTAVRITTDGSAPSSTRRKLVFRPDPDSSAKFFYGSSGVASSGASSGVPVFPAESVEMEFDAGDYYIISDTAAQSVFIVEQE